MRPYRRQYARTRTFNYHFGSDRRAQREIRAYRFHYINHHRYRVHLVVTDRFRPFLARARARPPLLLFRGVCYYFYDTSCPPHYLHRRGGC